MEIRYLNENDDKMLISRIYEKSWKYAYKDIISKDYLDDIKEGRWINNFDIPGWSNMVMIENGEYIGTSTFSKSRYDKYPDSGEIISIYLLPEFIGKGYGEKLINAVFNELRKQNYKDVFLWVLEDNISARNFYERIGFKETDDYLNNIIGCKELKEVRYVYMLPDNKFSIRELGKEEYDKAISLVLDVFNETEAKNYSKEGIEEFYKTVHDDSFISSLRIYGAFIDEVLIGVIATRNNGTHIALFFVDCGHHKQGTGRRLFEYLLNKTDSEKITVNSSVYARSFYHKLGFVDTDSEKDVHGIRFIPMEYIKK